MNQRPELVGGRSNHAPLSEQGSREAIAAGLWLRREGIRPVRALSSGAVRADMTGSLALDAAGLRLPLERDQRLQEMSQGQFEGKPRVNIYTPEMVARLERAGLSGSLPGGESILDVQLRMLELLDELHRDTDGVVLIFGHGLAIRALAGKIDALTKAQILQLETDNVSATRIDSTNGSHSVAYVGKNVIDA